MSEFEQQQNGNSHLITPTPMSEAGMSSVHAANPTAAETTSPSNQFGQRFAQTCPLRLPAPSTCPFGGICHSCPARLQAKLTVSQPDDEYEEEEDRVADQVMTMPKPQVQRTCPLREDETLQTKPLEHQITPLVQRQEDEPEEEEEPVQTKRSGGETPRIGPALAAQIHSLRGGGEPLPQSTRNFFEPRFGHNFGNVRVHTNGQAIEAALALNARAFTSGKDMVFGTGQYVPEDHAGQKLLAHELTHVVQQEKNNRYLSGENNLDTLLQRSPSSIERSWGGFQIWGDEPFVNMVREHLNELNKTKQGKALLEEIRKDRSGLFASSIVIKPLGACGFKKGGILWYNKNCVVNSCPNEKENWRHVPNYVWLFHEIVHAYLYYIKDKSFSDPDLECMTVGLGNYFNSIPYSENRLRCELNLPVRPCYAKACTKYPPPICPSKTVKTSKINKH